jgi:hypothetical protein
VEDVAMSSRWLPPWAALAVIAVASFREAGGQEDYETVIELDYARTARRVLPKLREMTREKLVAAHLKKISDDFLGEKPREDHKGSIEAVEELGVLLADDAVSTIRKALEGSGQLEYKAMDFQRLASEALLQIGLSSCRNEDERITWALARAQALPLGAPEANAIRGYFFIKARKEGPSVLRIVARSLRDNAIRYDAERLIDLVQGAYWKALKKGEVNDLFRQTLGFLIDPSVTVRRFEADFIGDFVAVAALPTKDVYKHVIWLESSLKIAKADAAKRLEVEESCPEFSGKWDLISEGMRAAIRRAIEATKRNLEVENKELDAARVRLQDESLSPEERASLQKQEADHAANQAHYRAMADRLQAAVR